VLKKFIAGTGKAEKNTLILEVYKRFRDHDGFPISARNDNEADAVGLAFIGKSLLRDYPPQNQAQREVLAKLGYNAEVTAA
jgi:hypothetical protein